MSLPQEQALGEYLKHRRTKLDPVTFGFSIKRRRTSGLRREEVAQRAHISVTWYTWLEQGRGGKASADVLDRIARALMLTDIEREHLFMLGLGRPPEVQCRSNDVITPRLQRLLDMLPYSPAIIRTVTWDVIAWNQASASLFIDYGKLPVERRNLLRLLFCDARFRSDIDGWESVARHMVGFFRIEAARAGIAEEVKPLIAELSAASPEFTTLWHDPELQANRDVLRKVSRPDVGDVTLEYSGFAVAGRPDLQMIVYNPVTSIDLEGIRRLVESATVTGYPQ